MKERYLPIDLLRGATIILMIMVNMPGSWAHIHAPLKHSAWHGCTAADMVFPLFLFITGFSMAFSLSKVRAGETVTAADRRSAHLKVLRRCLL
ncbi:MAG TPA: heparan-alpha-glucosaminide N-acetyltransferase domain-containing protein, partial [Candidatus Krumholzibacterium sp.]|nr:heparan-alpha-glucosaminide N-acetyltransferase domain-containing protein [Candidatus Krumholzibacterium sp.]